MKDIRETAADTSEKKDRVGEAEQDLSFAKQSNAFEMEQLGDDCMREGRREEAVTYYEKSIRIREETARNTASLLARRKLADAYRKLGIAYSEMSGPDNDRVAEEYYRKAIGLYILLEDETPDWLRVSEIRNLKGKPGLAKKPDCTIVSFENQFREMHRNRYFEKASLHGAVSWLFSCWRYAKQLEEAFGVKDACQAYEELQEAADQCTRDGFPVACFFKAIANEGIGRLSQGMMIREDGSLDDGIIMNGERCLNEAHVAYRRLAEEEPGWAGFLGCLKAASVLQTIMEETLYADDVYDSMIKWYRESIRLIEGIGSRQPCILADYYRAYALCKTAEAHVAGLRYEASLEYYEECISVAEKIASSVPGTEAPHILFRCHKTLGDIYEETDEFQKAESHYHSAIEALSLPVIMSASEKKDTASIYQNLGFIKWRMNRMDEALIHYEEEFRIREALVKSEMPYGKHDLMTEYHNLSVSLRRRFGEKYEKEAAKYEKRAREIADDIGYSLP